MPDKNEIKAEKMLTYNDIPLQRVGNELYYGTIKGKYLLHLIIQSTEDFSNLKLAKEVAIELQDNTGPQRKTIRKASREGLFEALDLGAYWLSDAIDNG